GRTERNRLDRNGMVAAIEPPQHGHQLRLRLNRDDACPESPERADAIAYMRAEVEDEIAGIDELPVQTIHCGAPFAIAVIDAQRPHDPANGPPKFGHVRQAREKTPSRQSGPGSRQTTEAASFPRAAGRVPCGTGRRRLTAKRSTPREESRATAPRQ